LKASLSLTSVFIAIFAAASAQVPSDADLTMRIQTTVQMPSGRKDAAPNEKRASDSTMYVHGDKVAWVSQTFAYIADYDKHTMWMLDTARKSYSTTPVRADYFEALSLLESGTSLWHVDRYVDTGEVGTMLEHGVHLYARYTSLSFSGVKTKTVARFWMANDIVLPWSHAATQSRGANGQAAPSGMALQKTVTVTSSNSTISGTTMTQKVVSISTGPVPQSVFSIPAGYKQSEIMSEPSAPKRR
jgi:hypothetical protein